MGFETADADSFPLCTAMQVVTTNYPDDVRVEAGAIVQVAGVAGPWATGTGTSYTMYYTPVLTCAANFSNGDTTTCSGCSSADWNNATCTCRATGVSFIMTHAHPTGPQSICPEDGSLSVLVVLKNISRVLVHFFDRLLCLFRVHADTQR